MPSKQIRKNETFWPDELVDVDKGGSGWVPIARLLTMNWRQFKLGSEHFTTLVWLLTWVRKDFDNIRFSQAAIAHQQGVHRTTVYRQMLKLDEEGVIRLDPNERAYVSLTPLMNKLAAFEKERVREKSVRENDDRLKAAGLMEDLGGRPPKATQPSTAAFGTPEHVNEHGEPLVPEPTLADLDQDYPFWERLLSGSGMTCEEAEMALQGRVATREQPAGPHPPVGAF